MVELKVNGVTASITGAGQKTIMLTVDGVTATLSPKRTFAIGTTLEHTNGHEYVLAQIKQTYGPPRAYLINLDSGRARNSRKVVLVKDGCVEDLPAEKDQFIDPAGNGRDLI